MLESWVCERSTGAQQVTELFRRGLFHPLSTPPYRPLLLRYPWHPREQFPEWA